MAILYEYHNEVIVSQPKALKNYLHTVWQGQYAPFRKDWPDEGDPSSGNPVRKEYQPFLDFDGNEVRARNYVGFIQLNDLHLEIYPKVFKMQRATPGLMLRHLFFWFNYCRKWRFPFVKADLDRLENIELPELIIYLMASKILDTVLSTPISLYQPVEESLQSPKGRINFSRYLSAGFLSGNHHLIDCDYELSLFDNKLNRIIKYCARILLKRTCRIENQQILEELIFILDEVEDQAFHSMELDTIVVNPLFSDYEDVKEICRTVLDQLLYANQQYDLSQWCLLFPMEYIFEDFIAGFLAARFSNTWKIEYQKSNLYLSSDPEVFRMQHDIFLTRRDMPAEKIIVDAKYKLRNGDLKTDKKKGIAQADMYQMVSYAVRRGVNKVLLLYPNQGVSLKEPDRFIVRSGFPGAAEITIVAAEIPFWSIADFDSLPEQLYWALDNILKGFY